MEESPKLQLNYLKNADSLCHIFSYLHGVLDAIASKCYAEDDGLWVCQHWQVFFQLAVIGILSGMTGLRLEGYHFLTQMLFP